METNSISTHDALIFASLCVAFYLIFLAVNTARERIALYKKIKADCDEALELGQAFLRVFEDKKDALYPIGAWEQIAQAEKEWSEFRMHKAEKLTQAKAQIKIATKKLRDEKLARLEELPNPLIIDVFDEHKGMNEFKADLYASMQEGSAIFSLECNQIMQSLTFWSRYYNLLFGLLNPEAKKDESLLNSLEAFVQKVIQISSLPKIKGRFFERFEDDRQRMLAPIAFNVGFFLKAMGFKERAKELEQIFKTT